MRIRTLVRGGHGDIGFGITGGTVNSAVILSRDPVENNEASTKRYVDNRVANLNTTDFTTGTLAVGRLPAFTGDVTSAAGSNVFTLSNTGVVAGRRNKVTVDARGRVTASANLVESDLPAAISWNKITAGRPTSLSGYGITDAVFSTGSAVTGFVRVSAAPTIGVHAANKAYVDNLSSIMPVDRRVRTGDVIRRATDVTPSGFLRVNGAELDRTTFAGLFSVIGERYNIIADGTIPGSGRPWEQQYDINLDANPTLGTWSSPGNLPEPNWAGAAMVTRNRVFLLGGQNGPPAHISTIFTAPINADGTLGTWTTAGDLPSVLFLSSAIVTRNRVFLLGGDITSATISTIFTAPINADGTLGAWTTAGNLPSILNSSSAIVTRNRVFLLGGNNGSAVISTIFTAPINADGTLGAWTTAGNLPSGLWGSVSIVTRNRVFLISGRNESVHISTIFTATLSGATLNDYSMYYDGSIQPTSATTFRLPDYTAQENFSTFFYIKT